MKNTLSYIIAGIFAYLTAKCQAQTKMLDFTKNIIWNDQYSESHLIRVGILRLE